MENDLKDRNKKFSISVIDIVESMDYSIFKKSGNESIGSFCYFDWR